MTDLNTIAENYITAWNESDPAHRQTLLDAAFTEDVSYRDPIMQGDGHAGIATLIDGVQQRFAGFRFSLKGKPDGFADRVRHRRHRYRRHREWPAEKRHRLPRQGAGAVSRDAAA